MSRMSISMCENDGVPSVRTMCSACAASATRSASVERRRVTRSSTSWAPGSSNGMRPLAHGAEALGVVVDAEHAQAAVGEARARAAGRPGRAR